MLKAEVRRLKPKTEVRGSKFQKPRTSDLETTVISLVSHSRSSRQAEIGIDRFPYGCYKGAQWLHSASVKTVRHTGEQRRFPPASR